VIPGLQGAGAAAINDKGTIVGTYPVSPSDAIGFVYHNGVVQQLAFPGSDVTYAQAINDSGQVAGLFYDSQGLPHGFLWTPPSAPQKGH
jgi:probable HAF family extracellular repeat protein